MNNGTQEIANLSNFTSIIGDNLAMGQTTGSKKKGANETVRKDDSSKDKNSVEMTKIQILLKESQESDDESDQKIGFVEIPTSELSGDSLSIVSPKLIVSGISQRHYWKAKRINNFALWYFIHFTFLFTFPFHFNWDFFHTIIVMLNLTVNRYNKIIK